MLLTKKVVKFNNHFLIKIPFETKNLNDLSENRWGYKKLHYFKQGNIQLKNMNSGEINFFTTIFLFRKTFNIFNINYRNLI